MRVTKNPYYKTPEHAAYLNMVNRCKAPRSSNKQYIYDRGIGVHETWLGERGFLNFIACVGDKPEGTVLGRLDRFADYQPGNVRWMTYSEFNSLRPTPFNPKRKRGYQHYVSQME